MQTIQFLQTANWIIKLISEETRINIFEGGIFHERATRRDESRVDGVGEILNSIHELSRLQPEIERYPFALQVLMAFQLENILRPDWLVYLTRLYMSTESESMADLHRWLSPTMDKWKIFTSCIGPCEKLTIPVGIMDEKDFDDILTLEIRSEGEALASVENVMALLESAHELYTQIARAHGTKEPIPLTLAYASTGSSLRIDLKGLGAPIKEVKKALIETWTLIRHRKAASLQANSRAALDGLAVIQSLNVQVERGSLSPEEANLVRERVLKSIHGIFDAGALPREIRSAEIVPNQVLIEAMNPKLLTSGINITSNGEAESPEKKKGKGKKISAKKVLRKEEIEGKSNDN